MPNKSQEQYQKFNNTLKKLKDEGKISDAPPPIEKEKRKDYIAKLTKLFKKEIYGSD